ncbi:hypothetical protein J6TS2_33670 [Heyndrickxia sporothermodurans]|nr:hypothetical protein J6TS2_33670 [Heyndrickxia sporothermodurans]
MFPILYDNNETNFIHNGLGVLSGAITVVPEEELNGLFEIKIEYDSEGFLADQIENGMIVKVKANDKQDPQLFRIYAIEKSLQNDNLIIHGQHITYDLAGNFIELLVLNNATTKDAMEAIKANLAYPTRFNITSTNNTTKSSTTLFRTNPLQMIAGMEGSILQHWGGQIERDNFHLIMHKRRGSDDGVLVTYKKNLTGLEAKFDESNVVTRIFPFKYDEETDKLITIEGKYIDSPNIDKYPVIKILPVDYSDDENITNSTDLYNGSKNFFNVGSKDLPTVEMEVEFEPLHGTEEYKDIAVLELVGMGDTITVRHSKMGIDVKAEVVKIEYDSIAEKNKKVHIGNVKARMTDSVNKASDIASTVDEKVRNANEKAQEAIKAANGKNTNFYGPDEPTRAIKDDLWFKVVDGEYTRTYRFDGVQWQIVVSVDAHDAINEATVAKRTAEEAVENANIAIGNAEDAVIKADEATGQVSKLAQTVSGLQSTVSEKADQDFVESQFSQLANDINLRVKENDVINQINISTEGVLIQGKKLQLDGDVTVTGNFKVGNANITSVDAGKMTTGTLDAGKVSVINLDASNIVTGKLKAIEIEGAYGSFTGKISSLYDTSSLKFGTEMKSGGFYYASSNGFSAELSGTRLAFARYNSLNVDLNDIQGTIWGNSTNKIADTDLSAGEISVSATDKPANWINRKILKLSAKVSGNEIASTDNLKINAVGDITLDAGIGKKLTLGTSSFSSLAMLGYNVSADLLGTLTFNCKLKSGNVYFNKANSVVNDTGNLTLQGKGGGAVAVGSDTTGGRLYSMAAYNRTYSGAANMYITSSGTIGRSTSARKYKLNEKPIPNDVPYKVLDLIPKTWYDKSAVEAYSNAVSQGLNLDDDEDIPFIERIPGLIAEDVLDAGLGQFVIYGEPDENGNREVEGLMYDRLWTLLIPIVREQKEKIDTLVEQNEQLILKYANLEERLSKLEVA